MNSTFNITNSSAIDISTAPDDDQRISWYRANECVVTDELMPFFLVIFGVFVKGMISWFIFVYGEMKEDDDEEKAKQAKQQAADVSTDENFWQTDTFKTLAKYGKDMLAIYTVFSMLLTLVLDIGQLNKADIDKDDGFFCFMAILVQSSNCQTMFLGMITIMLDIVFNDKNKNKNKNKDDSGNEHEDDTYESSISKKIWTFTMVLFFLLYLPFLFVGYGGGMLYIWIIIGLVIILGSIYYVTSSKWGEQYPDIFFFVYMRVMIPILFVIIYVVLTLAFINAQSGISYWNSLVYVLNERKWDRYWGAIKDNAQNTFRVFTGLFI